MAYEHPSGLPRAYDRVANAATEVARLVFQEGNFTEHANLNELQTIEARRNRRVGNMIAKDGDRVSGCDIILDTANNQAFLASGTVYVKGDVRPVAAAVVSGIAASGEFLVGVRLQKTVVTSDTDPTLLGLQPGSDAEGEPTAAREIETLVWSRFGDLVAGDFYQVYLVRDGAVIDQTEPAALTGVFQQIATYDRDANGNYIVSGCEVTALGKVGGEQVFSIAAGRANISGWKRVREYALTHRQIEEPDLETISGETFTFTGPTNGSTVVTVNRAPIASIQTVIVVKRITENIVRGVTPGGLDALTKSSVVAIESITQGATTYTATTDYVRSGDSVSWAPAGIEPAAASTYSVTYTFNEAVTPTAITDTTFTCAGGVNGTTGLVSYTSKMPRIDLLCLDITGSSQYVKGISARRGAIAPLAPTSLLKLAEIRNTWLGTPTVINNGTFSYSYDKQRRFFEALVNVLEQFDRSEAERNTLAVEPVSKKGIFTDTFFDDFYRDQGAAQTAAVTGASLELAVDLIDITNLGTNITTLDYTEEVVIRQELATSNIKINPYANFTKGPSGLRIQPATDFWTEQQTIWTSPVTQQFTAAPNVAPGTVTINDTISETQVPARFLRQRSVSWTIEGFGVGENLATLTFDGLNVKPAGTQTADSNGEITGSFTIPAGVPVGSRLVRATGAAGSFAEAIFHGEGTIDVSTMRRVNLVTRAAPPPVNVTIIQQVTNPNTGAGGRDPLAQTFTLVEPRHIAGVDFRVAVKGNGANGVRVQLVTVQNGLPTTEILAETFINMNPVAAGSWVSARFPVPVYCSADREFAFVFLTDDALHALSIAKLGDVNTATQQFVSAQAYTVGVLLASANRLTWTPIQEADLTFRVVAAIFAPTTKTVTLWTGAWTNISDVTVRAAVEIPEAAAACRFELVRASGQVIQIANGQNVAFSEFVSETVTLRAVLSGSARVAPILYPGAQLITGRLRTTGTYVTRLFPMGTAVTVRALFQALLPAGASVSVDVDAGNDVWQSMTLGTSNTLGGGWIEPTYSRTGYTATSGRVRLSLTGSPAARPAIGRLRAYSL